MTNKHDKYIPKRKRPSVNTPLMSCSFSLRMSVCESYDIICLAAHELMDRKMGPILLTRLLKQKIMTVSIRLSQIDSVFPVSLAL